MSNAPNVHQPLHSLPCKAGKCTNRANNEMKQQRSLASWRVNFWWQSFGVLTMFYGALHGWLIMLPHIRPQMAGEPTGQSQSWQCNKVVSLTWCHVMRSVANSLHLLTGTRPVHGVPSRQPPPASAMACRSSTPAGRL